MRFLSLEQKSLLFDYCLGIASDKQVNEAESLVSSQAEADQFVQAVQAKLAPLNTLDIEICPESLVDKTIAKLVDKSGLSTLDFNLPHQPQVIRIGQGTWRKFIHIAAVAAILLVVVSIFIPSLNMLRQKQYQNRCISNLGDIFRGLSGYISDHEEYPTVQRVSGEPWWKVGYQGNENHSNTRAIWLLPKHGYVDLDRFLCSARQKKNRPDLSAVNVNNLHDFPGRNYIDYSFRIACPKQLSGRTVLMADMNPMCEDLPSDYSRRFVRIRLNKQILNANSINHQGRGQVIMFNDGSVIFSRTRFVNIYGDDIYTLRSMTSGTDVNGCEIPLCSSDAFLAP